MAAIFGAAALVTAFLVFSSGKGQTEEKAAAGSAAQEQDANVISVKVVNPSRGGMKKITDQPGTIRAFDRATLYAKVSGYLKELKVDRGDHVKAGTLLAQIYVPELDVAVQQAESDLLHAKALVTEAEARVKTALAGVQAAEAKKNEALANKEKAVAYRQYRKKALDRMTDLARRNAAEQRLVDEYEDDYMASISAEHAASSEIQTAEAKISEAKANVILAEADLATAKTEVQVAEANLEKAKVMLSYTRIESPFDGVVTFRGEGMHKGAFIRSAADGNSEPLLAVATTDVMRTIVQVPDPDVPFCNVGDPATIRIDALGGREFKGKVSRMAESEDIKDRTMRVEIDLPNDHGIFRDGMYGRAIIELEPPTQNLTIPATCLIEQNGTEGAVYVVRDGKVKRVPIKVGKDSGLSVEVLSGLSPDDQLVAQITPAISEGVEVKPELATVAAVGKKGSSE